MPNTVPAAAIGLPVATPQCGQIPHCPSTGAAAKCPPRGHSALPNRRTALLASLAGLGAVAARPTVACASSCSDPVVAEMADLYAEASRRSAAADKAYEAADDRYKGVPYPDALFVQDDDPLAQRFTPRRHHGGREWFGTEERINMLRRWDVDSMTGSFWSLVLARRAEVLTAYDAHQAAAQAAMDAAGIPQAHAVAAAAWAVEKAIRLRIIDYRSSAPEALRLKLRVYLDVLAANDWREGLDNAVARGIEADGGPWEDAFAASIVRDLVTAHQEAAHA